MSCSDVILMESGLRSANGCEEGGRFGRNSVLRIVFLSRLLRGGDRMLDVLHGSRLPIIRSRQQPRDANEV